MSYHTCDMDRIALFSELCGLCIQADIDHLVIVSGSILKRKITQKINQIQLKYIISITLDISYRLLPYFLLL